VASLPGEDAREHYWQSVLFIERALLLSVSRMWWTNLSGSYNGLFLYANMLHVSLKAEEGMPKDVVTLEERAKVLINTGQFKPAEAILNELRSNESIDPPIRLLYQSWQAVIDYYAGNYPEAQKNIGALLDQSPDDFWGICLRSNIWLATGKQQQAMDDVEWIWNRRDDPRHKDQQFEFARAAFLKGMFSETLARLQSILTTASGDERFSALLFAGLSNLATGNLAVAEDQLSEALEISNPRSVIDFVIELKQLEQRSKQEKWKEQTAITELLNKPESVLKRALQKQREVKTYEADPIKELEVVLAGPATGQVGSWSWLAAQASLGRLYVEANRKADARRVYLALCEFPNAIPEARTALASLDPPEAK
jgi:tetratricopeptide (TPR) repeat protein